MGFDLFWTSKVAFILLLKIGFFLAFFAPMFVLKSILKRGFFLQFSLPIEFFPFV